MIRRLGQKASDKIVVPMITQRTAQGGIATVSKSGHTVINSTSQTAQPIKIRRRGR